MSAIDDLLRTTLQDTPPNEIEMSDLANQLTARRANQKPKPSNGWRRRAMMAAPIAAAIAVVALIVGVAGRDTSKSTEVVADGTDEPAQPTDGTGEPTQDPTGFAALGAGWHQLPNTPVPSDSGFQTAWTGTEVVAMWVGGAASYKPGDDAWIPFDVPSDFSEGLPSIGWAGDRLVAVAGSTGSAPADSATWDPETRTWTSLDQAPWAEGLTAAGIDGVLNLGILDPQGNDLLAWTGERLIDFTRGAVLNPAEGTWAELPMPESLEGYPGLFPSSDPDSWPNAVTAWDGKELTLRSLAQTPGLAWDATGSSFRELPPPPESITNAMMNAQRPGSLGRNVGRGTGNRVVYVSNTEPTTVVYDSITNSWAQLPDRPTPEMECVKQVLSLGSDPLVQRCEPGGWLLLASDGWQSVPPQPGLDPGTGGMMEDRGRWLDAGGSLLRLAPSSDGGTSESPNSAWVWVPGGSATNDPTPKEKQRDEETPETSAIEIEVTPGDEVGDILATLDAASPNLGFDDFLKALESGDVTSPYLPEEAPTEGPGISGPPQSPGEARPAIAVRWEGLLAPVGFGFPADADATTILQALADRQAGLLDELGATDREDLIVASLVEAESLPSESPEGRAKIARVIYNRLAADEFLGIDATAVHSKGKPGQGATADDLRDESDPYNTRTKLGLPPTPIGTPSKGSIQASVDPADGAWMYYVLTAPDKHSFFTTEAEFIEARDQARQDGVTGETG